MAHTDTEILNLIINRGTLAKIQENLSQIGENELIITSDYYLPIPTASDSGKALKVNASGTAFEWVAIFSGNYNDLTNKPTIPTKTSDITNDSGFITSSYHDATKYDASNPSGYQTASQVASYVSGHHDSTKQDVLTAGSNIQINGTTISATDTTYSSKSAMSGGTEVSLVTTGEKYTWNNKQNALTAGSNISISGNTISATDTTYTSQSASSGGTAVSLCTTGEKYTWNAKQALLYKHVVLMVMKSTNDTAEISFTYYSKSYSSSSSVVSTVLTRLYNVNTDKVEQITGVMRSAYYSAMLTLMSFDVKSTGTVWVKYQKPYSAATADSVTAVTSFTSAQVTSASDTVVAIY